MNNISHFLYQYTTEAVEFNLNDSRKNISEMPNLELKKPYRLMRIKKIQLSLSFAPSYEPMTDNISLSVQVTGDLRFPEAVIVEGLESYDGQIINFSLNANRDAEFDCNILLSNNDLWEFRPRIDLFFGIPGVCVNQFAVRVTVSFIGEYEQIS